MNVDYHIAADCEHLVLRAIQEEECFHGLLDKSDIRLIRRGVDEGPE